MGWPRSREQAALYTKRLHSQLHLSPNQPLRLAHTPPLLTPEEVDELRRYPGGIMTFVLITWSLQVAKGTGDMPGPTFGPMMASAAKLRAAAYKVRLMLSMPVPLPYCTPRSARVQPNEIEHQSTSHASTLVLSLSHARSLAFHLSGSQSTH